MAFAREFQNVAGRFREVEKPVLAGFDWAKDLFCSRIAAWRSPRLLQPQSCVKDEALRCVGVENIDKSVGRHGDAEEVARARMCSQPQLTIAIAFSSGKEKENAAPRRIRHVDHSAVIHRDRLRMLQTVFLKRE